MPGLFGNSSYLHRFLESTVYYAPEPPPRKRDPSKPMQVICPGFPRSATESLQTALLKLGYDHTYHGWDILFETPNYSQAWVRLAKKKWYGNGDGESNITAEDFDAILGHSVAVTDAASSVFAAEMIAAYPDAKVILNTRRDLDAWHKSAIERLGGVNENWVIYFLTHLTWTGFWSWTVYENYLWALLFRQTDGSNLGLAIRRNGKWIYREHIAMVKGLVPKERLLEWTVEDGWEPLCKFLDKPIPAEPFPLTNNAAGFAEREKQWHEMNQKELIRNVSVFLAVVATGVGLATWRFAPGRTTALGSVVKGSAAHVFELIQGLGRRS